ncbi:MAG: phospholipase D-like domain-containing protein, partial [Caldimonas sp.]
MRPLSWLRLLALASVVALAGCAALPSQVVRTESRAIAADAAATSLGRVQAASVPPGAAGLSGFRLLPGGDDALEARLTLIASAEKSVDVQYYLVADDGTGHRFLAALADAAARGVRVRLLVDDLHTIRADALFAALSTLPGVEVRLFNPLPARSGGFAARVALSAHEFGRINRRMHNKLLIADGSFAVTGGRNIADEYFGRGDDANFIDMDLLSSGPIVAAQAASFDEFWNSRHAYPAASLVRSDGAAVAAALQALRAAAATGAAAEDDERSLAADLARGR